MTARRTFLRGPVSLPSPLDVFAFQEEVPDAVPMTDAGKVRALTMHDVVPAGHIAVPIVTSCWEPHLRPGEFAILDVSDTEPQPGELYGLMVGSMGVRKLHIVQPYRSKLFAGCDDVMFRFEQPRSGGPATADGPLMREHWHRTCRGRVVGVLTLAEVEVPS